MNYLAHIYFSGNSLPMQLGGFIADGVKGKKYIHYSPKIQEGIIRHRKIDSFIDTHPLISDELSRMRPVLGKFSPVILDIFLDHILAANFKRYTGQSLRLLAFRFNSYLLFSYTNLPSRFKRFVWHFILSDRLVKYKTENGIRESLEIMKSYRGLSVNIPLAMEYLQTRYTALTDLLDQLFPELQKIK